MTEQHPVTPSLELVDQWVEEWLAKPVPPKNHIYLCIATQAARWGADQELKECCQVLYGECMDRTAVGLRAKRRPKPPSLKQRITAAIKDGDERTALLLLNEVMPDDSL